MGRRYESSAYSETSNIPVSDYPFTMSDWFYLDDSDAFTNSPSMYWDGHSSYQVLGIDSSVALACSRSNNEYCASSGNAPDLAAWNHVIGTFPADAERNVVLNGDLANKGTETTSVNFAGQIDTLGLGRLRSNAPTYEDVGTAHGEFGIWDVELTDSEIESLAAGASPRFIRPDHLVTYMPLWDSDQEWVHDYAFSDNGAATEQSHPPIFYPTGQWVAEPPSAGGGGGGNPWYAYAAAGGAAA